jgi:hypothetical protein
VVYSNTTPVELAVSIATNTWTRFDVYCDYETLTWNLSVNKSNVVAGLPLYSSNQQIDSVIIQNEGINPVYIDEIAVTDIEPAADPIDKDSDGIPDWWEQKHFGGISAANPAALASNGANNLRGAYIAGLNPTGIEKFDVSIDRNNSGRISWSGRPGRIYSVYWASNLLSGFTTLLQSDIPANTAEFVDTIRANEPAGFYEVKVGLSQ